MNQPNITCPQCNHAFRLDESLAAPLIESTRREFELKITQQNADIAKREVAVKAQQCAIEKAKLEVDEQVANKLKTERERIAADELKKARAAMASEFETKARQLADLNELFQQNNLKLAEAQKAQAEFIQKQRALDDEKREIDLTIEKKVGESLSSVREKAKKEAEDALSLQLAEEKQRVAAMAKQIDELKRKVEQGSQQSQGEALELQLESLLRGKFPRDTIEPVAKGEFGGDVLHRVLTSGAQVAGTILWESKRTKAWSDGWLGKLRDDQRAAKADFAVIVSQVVCKGVAEFDLIDGVWVTEPQCAIPLAVALRHAVLEIAATRQAGEGQQTKMEMVYHYMTGPAFRHRLQAIVEKYTEMTKDLEKERKFLTAQWAKREQQMNAAIVSTTGMYGDLRGIVGKSLAEIEEIEPKLLDDLAA